MPPSLSESQMVVIHTFMGHNGNVCDFRWIAQPDDPDAMTGKRGACHMPQYLKTGLGGAANA
jgi:hypothetical protein